MSKDSDIAGRKLTARTSFWLKYAKMWTLVFILRWGLSVVSYVVLIFFSTQYIRITAVLVLKWCLSLSLFHQHTLISQSLWGNPAFLTDYLSKVYLELCSCMRLTWHDTSLFIPTGCPSDQKPNFRHVRLLVTWHGSQVWKISKVMWDQGWIVRTACLLNLGLITCNKLYHSGYSNWIKHGEVELPEWAWLIARDVVGHGLNCELWHQSHLQRLSMSMKEVNDWQCSQRPNAPCTHSHTQCCACKNMYSFIRVCPETWFICNSFV